MRILYSFIFSIFCSIYVTAQPLDFNQVVRPADELTSFEDYLVYLAWLNHPVAGKLSNQAEIAAIEIKTEKLGYWETIMPFVNFSTGNNSGLSAPIVSPNPGEIPMTQSDGRSNAVSFGLSFRLLPLLTTKHRVDAAKENYDIAQLEIDEGKLLVRREVLAAYRSLLLYKKW
ncbi:MAG: TolC family protein [Saprospiraceae bacterium]|nr:TolC family protein [Saprospiraceae bacterium]